MNSANIKYHIQHKQQLNQNIKLQRPQSQQKQKQQQKQLKGQDLSTFNNAVRELCSMYDAVNYFGKAEYARKNGWRVINKEQLNTATIYAIRYAPVVPKRSVRQQKPQQRQQKQQPRQQQQKPQQQKQQQLLKQQPKKQQLKQQPKQQQRQQPRQQSNKGKGGRRIGGCPYKPNVPRSYPYNTAPLPSNLYPTVNNFNHLYDAFNYFGNSQVRNIKSWIENSRTHKLSSIASVFAKRNAPYVPIRHNRSNKRNQRFQKRPQQQFQRNIPKQQSNKRPRNNNNNNQKKRLMINQQPLSNVWEEYYVSPKRRLFK
jgi:hypothetical protein